MKVLMFLIDYLSKTMVNCAAWGCFNSSNKDKKCHYFKFPSEETDAARRKVWIQRCQRGEKQWNPSTHAKLCSEHFEASAFDKNPVLLKGLGFKFGRVNLKKDAVPTLFPEKSVLLTVTRGAHRKLRTQEVMSSERKVIDRRKEGPGAPPCKWIKKEVKTEPPASIDEGSNVTPLMSSKNNRGQTVVFDGTIIKQEWIEFDEKGFDKEPSEVRVTLPTGSGSTLTHADVAATKGFDDDTKQIGSNRTLLRSMIIKQEPMDDTLDGVKVRTEGGTTGAAGVDTGGNIVCTGNTEGDEWVVQKVIKEEEEGQQKVDVSIPQPAQLGTRHLVNHIIQSAISTGLLTTETPSAVQDMDTSVSVKQENSSSLQPGSASPITLDKGKLCSLLIRNMLETNPTSNETSLSKPDKPSLHAEQSTKDKVQDSQSDVQNVTPAMVGSTGDSPEDNIERKCDYCNKVCSTADSYKFHILYHTSMATLNADGVTVECTECKTLLPRNYIKYHLKIHLGAKPYKCSQCNKAFIHQRSLLYHSKIHNRKKQIFNCSICNKEFAHEYLLRRHSVIHEKYKCSICGHYSSDKHKFAAHKNRHETKMFTCDICGKNYSKEASLFSHKSSVHNATGNVSSGKLIMYRCDDCGDVFSKIPMLKDHLLICEERDKNKT